MDQTGSRSARRFLIGRRLRRSASPIGLAAVAACLGACAGAPKQPVAVNLFDGRTLAGWTQRGGKAEYRVEDGMIVGATRPNQPNSFLCTDNSYSDFILDIDFKVDPRLNSGIQIRSESRPDYKNGIVHGYQIEIDPSARAWTAGIYDESRRGWLAPLDQNPAAQAAFKQNQWNHIRVRAEGDQILTWLNGVPTAALRDSMTLSGFIGLQVHGVGSQAEEMTVRFRNIRLVPLAVAPRPE